MGYCGLNVLRRCDGDAKVCQLNPSQKFRYYNRRCHSYQIYVGQDKWLKHKDVNNLPSKATKEQERKNWANKPLVAPVIIDGKRSSDLSEGLVIEAPRIPELDRLDKVWPEYKAIGDFIEWLQQKQFWIGYWSSTYGTRVAMPICLSTERLLQYYFKLDPIKLERERQILLERQIKLNNQKQGRINP
jgi:hypothetical protein